MPKRKPVPATPRVADPSITRYSLSDGPYNNVSNAVDRMLGRYDADENRPLSTIDPFGDAPSSVDSHETVTQAPPSSINHAQAQVDYRPYEPGQYLAPIITGETLQIESDLGQLPLSGRLTPTDPFQHGPTVSLTASTPVSSHPPLPSTSVPPSPGGGDYYTYPSNPEYMQPIEQYASPYPDSNGPHPLPAGTESIDHFHYDTEAYASGTYSRASYRPPRSRSPTPAVDDEDYYVVGNESIHYTRPPHEQQQYGYDPEKEAMQRYSGHYVEQGYLPNGDQVVFDPEPETPTSTLYSLPPVEPERETRHFGPAPTGRVVRRHKTKRRVQLTNGNLVVNLDVPPKLVLPYRGEPETMKTRYTAVTCDPDDFEKRGFFLRQNEMGRRTEMFIVITMYNEDEVLFCRTLYGVMRNIAHLCTRKNSQTWGPNAWEKVVVCIVADGRKKVHPRVLDCLTLLGVYQPGDHMKSNINGKPVTAHLFEYTTSFAIDPNLHFRYPDKGIVPTQIIFCMKERNQKKINSHRWFFNAFSPMLQPNVCVLLDVGTRPGNNSIYRLWKAFDVNSNVAGACGEIATYKGKKWSLLWNPLVAAQNFEYKISCILDKPTESMFGYISVLPGAFSAYRYIALQNDENGVGPLASYFKGEVLHGRDTDIFTSNMYLAEDRILCFELIAKANSSWILKYVKGAIGETDVPDALPEFISQRRRWLNGSFFAAVYAIAHVGQIMRSGHSMIRKTTFFVETVYNVINIVFAWFSIGNFFVFFVILTSSLEDPSFGLPGVKYFNAFAQFLMASLIVACFLFSMGNKPKSAHWKYKLTSLIFSILMLYMIIASIKCAVESAKQGGTANDLVMLSVIVTYGIWAFSSLLAFDPWHMLTSFVPYMLLSPTYINILNIYAFANLDDISWGTKQDDTPEPDLGAVIQDKHDQVDVEIFTEDADVNSIYEEALSNLRDRGSAKESSATGAITKTKENTGRTLSDAEREAEAKEYYAGVRTNVLLAWVLSNGVLLAFILGGMNSTDAFGQNQGLTKVKGYLVFILAFTAVSNIMRFTGSTLYLFLRLITG